MGFFLVSSMVSGGFSVWKEKNKRISVGWPVPGEGGGDGGRSCAMRGDPSSRSCSNL